MRRRRSPTGPQVLGDAGHVAVAAGARLDPEVVLDARAGRIEVHDGAALGTRAVVVGPARIGARAAVAPGAVVTGDLAPELLADGTPARPVAWTTDRPGLPPASHVASPHGPVVAPAGRGWSGPPGTLGGEDDPFPALAAAGLALHERVVEVGAGFGRTTLALMDAIGREGRLLAVEAAPANAWLLRSNLVARGWRWSARVAGTAAWSARTEVPFSPAQHDPHDHRTGQRLPGRPVRPAAAVPLDELVPLGEPVHLLVIDVNGAESAVVHGARRLLERARPRIVTRFSAVRLRQAGEDPVLVLAGWRGLGYDVEVLDEDGDHDDAAIVALCDARAQPGGGWVVLGLTPA